MSITNLTNDQETFVREALEAGLEVDQTYSGRLMKGKTCPSVKVVSLQSFHTKARGAQWDKLGHEYVIYCPATYW